MTVRRLSVAILLVAGLGPAHAGLTRQDISAVAASPEIGAQLPREARFTTRGGTVSLGQAIGGRPTLFIFADLTCATLCGVTLRAVAGALKELPLEPGRDYSLVVASIDPTDGPADAARMAEAQLGGGTLGAHATFLVGQGVDRLARLAGYAYSYDAENDAYAHPVGVYVLGPGGQIVRYVSGLGFDAGNLKLALDEARAGRTTPFTSRLLLLCYRFDPVTGLYTPAITTIVAASGAATAFLIAVAVGLLLWRERRSRWRG